MKTQIANQSQIEKNIRSLFQTRKPPVKSPLTPTQKFVASSLKEQLVKHDGAGKEKLSHWELRKLKGTRSILLASVVGRVKRFILIGPRGALQQLGDDSAMNKLQLDEAIEALNDGDMQGSA